MKRKLLAMAVVFTMILSQFTMLPLAADGDGTSPEVEFSYSGEFVDIILVDDYADIKVDEYAYVGDYEYLHINDIQITGGEATVTKETDEEEDFDFFRITPSKSGQITADFELCYPDDPNNTFHVQKSYLAVHSNMDIYPQKSTIISGQDTLLTAEIYEDEGLSNPEYHWSIYDEEGVKGSSITPEEDGSSLR